MTVHQPRTMPSCGYDGTCASFQSTDTPIFGYDASANWFQVLNPQASAGSVANFSRFTGKERDSESGLDYFGERYYGSALGRFTSPDWSAKPEPAPYADFSNPQTLNQYSYVLNNPLAKPDLDGHVVGVDDAVEGAIIVGVGATIAVSAYLVQPENQRSIAAAVNTAVHQIGSAIDSIFHTDKAAPPPRPRKGNNSKEVRQMRKWPGISKAK